MSRTRNRIMATVTAVLATAALAPAAGVASGALSERTPTELGQAVGEPARSGSVTANATYSRTPTELGQRVAAPVAPDVNTGGGFDWADAATGAGAAVVALGLIGIGWLFIRTRSARKTHPPVVPSS